MRFTFVFIMSIFVLLMGCSRPQEDNAKIKFQLPNQSKLGALNSDFLVRVIVNVSGSGISPTILKTWDARDLCPRCSDEELQPLPTAFELLVPQGDSRLIQVLAVYQNETTHGMNFYYGDSVSSLTSGDNNVAITIAQIGSGGAEQGRISGRYLDGVNSGPSGPIEVRYKPGSKPTMLIDREVMVNGWFEIFALKDISFTYFMPVQNLDLFGDVNLDSTVFTPSDKVIKVKVPEFSRQDDDDGPKTHVYGFFGGSTFTTGKSVCYQSNYTFTSIYQKGTTTPLIYDTSGTIGNDRITILKGGSTTSCADSLLPLTNDIIPVRAQQLDGNGNDSIAHFRGVFARFYNATQSRYQLLDMSNSGQTISTQFYVLPSLDNSKISGVKVFVTDFMINRDGIVLCEAFENGHLGFRKVAEQTYDFSSQGPHSISFPTPTGTSWSFALCPFKDGRTFNAGMIFTNEHFGGGGGATQIANDFDLHGPQKISGGQCHRFGLSLRNGSEYNVINDSAKSITFNLSGVTGVLYPTPDCTSGSVTTISVPAGQTHYVFSVMTSGGGTNGILESTTNSFNVTRQLTFGYVTTAGGATDVAFVSPFDHLDPYSGCKPVDLFVVDSNGFPTNGSVTLAVTKSDSSFEVYSDPICSTALTSLPISANFRATLFVKATSVVPDNSYVNVVWSTFADRLVLNPAPVVNNLIVKMYYNAIPYMTGNVFSQDCYEVRAESSSTNTAPVPIKSGIVASNGLFYTDSACVSGSSSEFHFEIPISQNVSSTSMYYKPNNAVASLIFAQNYNPFVANPMANLQFNPLNFYQNPSIIGANVIGWYKSFGAEPSASSWINSQGGLPSIGGTGNAPGQAALSPFGNNVMQFGGTTSVSIPTGLTDFSMALLVKSTGSNLSKKILSTFHTTTTYLGADSSSVIYMSGQNSGYTFNSGNWVVLIFNRDSVSATQENISLSINGSAFPAYYSNAGANAGDAVTNIYLGDSGASFTGEIAEMVVIDRIMSEAEKDIIYQYFKNRYPSMGLP